MADGKFQLISLATDYAFEFEYFPEEVALKDTGNWTPQDTTIGVKPLFYANDEPLMISVQDLILDSTETNTSLKPDIDILRQFKQAFPDDGPPTPLLAIWGDWSERVVLVDIDVAQIMFNAEGNCIRARLAIQLMQIQDGETTTVEIGDDT